MDRVNQPLAVNIVFLFEERIEECDEGEGDMRVVVSGPWAGDTAMCRLAPAPPGEVRPGKLPAPGLTEQGMLSTGGKLEPSDISDDRGTLTVLTEGEAPDSSAPGYVGGGPMGSNRLSLPISASLESVSIIFPPKPSPKNSSSTSILTSILLSSSSPFSDGSFSSSLTEAEDVPTPRTSEIPLKGSCLEDISGFTILKEIFPDS